MKIKTVLWGLATAALLVSCSGAKLSVANEQYARGEFYDAAQTYRKVYSKTKRMEWHFERFLFYEMEGLF